MAISWLHVSDFHLRVGDSYERDVVLGALLQSVREFRDRGRRPDLIFATGDIAYSGKAAEYALATTFFDALLEAAGLERRHLFLVPGNHDVDRNQGWGLARSLATGEEADNYFHPERPKPHLSQKLGAFRDWYNGYFQGIRELPADSTCGPLQSIDVRGTRLAILPLNAALFCQDENDHNKLLIGRRCLTPALDQFAREDAQLKLALIHHPLDWLSDVERANVKAGLQGLAHFILRGHLHDNDVESVITPSGSTLMMAAGASYQTRKYPNRALFVTVADEQVRVFPLRYEDSPREIWAVDPSLFPHAEDYEGNFALPKKHADPGQPPTVQPPVIPLRPGALPHFRSNIPSRGDRPFLGREALLQTIAEILAPVDRERVLLLHGVPGVGKSELAREFARRQRDRYPGGCFLIRTDAGAGILDLARIGSNALGLQFSADLSLQDQCERTLHALSTVHSLLIYDNVLDWEQIRPWLPASGMPCHVLVTSFNENLATGWPDLTVPPLPEDEALELVRRIGGADVAARHGTALVEQAGGLPVQIVSAASALGYESRRGHKARASLDLSGETSSSFGLAYGVLDHGSRLLLHVAACFNLQHILRDELLRSLASVTHPSGGDWEHSLDACLDLHLLEGVEDMRMHQLFAAFLHTLPREQAAQEALRQAHANQWERFTVLAGKLTDNLADRDLAHRLFCYRTVPEGWIGIEPAAGEMPPWLARAVAEAEQGDMHSRIDHEIMGRSLHKVGYCLANLGKYDEARPWFERAVAEAEQGDVHGRIDHDSLGRGLHEVGYCLSSLGKYDEAQPWYERAVTEAEQGDVHGRIDHASLGSSLHQVGYCLSHLGKYDEARQWFERAVTETEQGDVHGRIDHDILGRSLGQVGACLSNLGKYDEARQWSERAVAEAEQGDMHGRIDHDNLGRSLHQVGNCLSNPGKYDEAQPWFERAVVETEQGDVHGRIDHDNLGRSLHQVGCCLSILSKYDEAQPWFERAVAEKKRGDMHGRIGHDSLGRSLHEIGYCLLNLSKYDEAQPWFERAVAEKKQGDVHGRIDHANLGRSLHQVGYCLSKLGKYDEAGPWFEHAISEKVRGDLYGRVDHENVEVSRESLAALTYQSTQK